MKKHKILAIILSFVIVFLLFSWQIPNIIALEPQSISGTVDISSIDDLRELSGGVITDDVTINIKDDIDADYLVYTTPTVSGDPEITVLGDPEITEDGDGHLIKNLCTTKGFLPKLKSASNFGLYNCTITTATYSGDDDDGIGLLCGCLDSGGTISRCFATGSIYINDSGAENIGGLVGVLNGTLKESFAMCDITTNGSYVGGLVGRCEADGASINNCYSTGSIDNRSVKYYGGLVGISLAGKDVDANITDSYTNVTFKNPDVDTVNAIGFIKNLSNSVFYARDISLQRQGANDPYGLNSDKFNAKFTSSLWLTQDGESKTDLYPQIAYFANKTNFASISRISAVKVTPYNYGGTIGREYVQLSKITDSYAYAIISKENSFTWHISSGVDEYYFNPNEYYDAKKGKRTDGLSGNAFDHDNGKYLFTSECEVNFTAENGGYERTITVTVCSKNPYFTDKEFEINDYKTDVRGMRLYCNDYNHADQEYSLNNDLTLTTDFKPISGFQGTFSGNNHTIEYVLSPVDENFTENGGFFADIAGPATIHDLYIKNAEIKENVNDLYKNAEIEENVNGLYKNAEIEENVKGLYKNAGILVGKVDTSSYDNCPDTTAMANVSIFNCILSGTISAETNAGMLVGCSESVLSIDSCTTTGKIQNNTETDCNCAGGIIAKGKADVSNCYSSAVLFAKGWIGGIFANADDGSTVTTSLFTGMLEAAENATVNPIANAAVTDQSSCYYDIQTTAVDASTSTGAPKGKKTSELVGVLPDDPDDLFQEKWSAVTTPNPTYPQLKVFKSKNQTISELASIPVTYVVGTNNIGDSKYFNTATVGSTSLALAYDETGLYSGYSVSDNPKKTYTLDNGGQGTVKITTVSNDVRFLYFNVKTAKLYYKFSSDPTSEADTAAFNKFKEGKYSMLSITSDAPDSGSVVYNAAALTCADNYDDYYLTISPVRNTLTLKPELPYSLSVKVYKPVNEDEDSESEITGSGNTYNITVPTDGVIKVNFEISQKKKTLKWGNYDFKTFPLVPLV